MSFRAAAGRYRDEEVAQYSDWEEPEEEAQSERPLRFPARERCAIMLTLLLLPRSGRFTRVCEQRRGV